MFHFLTSNDSFQGCELHKARALKETEKHYKRKRISEPLASTPTASISVPAVKGGQGRTDEETLGAAHVFLSWAALGVFSIAMTVAVVLVIRVLSGVLS